MGKEGVEGKVDLPPGFRFFPTDEELVVHYLSNKVVSRPLPAFIIGEVDLYKYDPWQLPEKALFGEREWYFFTPRDRKYPNGSRPNRAAGSGYWKATGADKPITSCGGKKRVGVKKALVFYKGKAPKGSKTNWIMHEYRLAEINMAARKKNSLRLDDWVLCRIYNKKTSAEKIAERKIMEETPAKEEEMDSPLTMKKEGINSLQTVQSSDPSSHDANSTICAAVASSSSPNCMLSSLDVNPFYKQTPIITASYNTNTIPVPLYRMSRTTTGNYSSLPYCNIPNLIMPERDEVQSNLKTDNFVQKQQLPTQIQGGGGGGGGVTSQSLFNFSYGGGGLQSHNNNNNNFLPSEQIEAASFKNPYQDYIDTLYNLKCYQGSDMVLH